MSGVNKVMLVGRLGKEPEVRNLDNGAIVANFSIATSESYKDKTTGDKKEITEWHNIVIWGKLAEIVQRYVHKGDLIFVEGKLRTRSWEKDGVTRYTTEILGDNMTMLGSKGGAGGGSSSEMGGSRETGGSRSGERASTESYSAPADNSTDDLPF
jgi:single-strand DNA-binding protein